ncbi:DUF4249 domain-containing protein [Chitinophaga solisilvae]|uniref:DUF4249 domain-containing protein n=1 Tax=Chitinophaga solisilvae TaxID=1233460 RepID=UPI0013708BD4|nr:DUF4249 domain-containing protein [Chitinophaga solisilvae]
MKSIFVYALLLVALLTSCEKRVNISLPYEGDKIVVNSLIQPDSVIYIRVTRSVPSNVYDDSGFEEIKNAAVSIDQDGTPMPAPVQQVIKGQTFFVTAGKAERGKKYTIRVASGKLDPVTAGDTLPPAPAASEPGAVRTSSRIRFTLDDNPGGKDYYRFRLFVCNDEMQPVSMRSFRLDPAFSNNLLDNNYTTSLIINDERFNGKRLLFVLETQEPITSQYLMLEVSSLTHNSYQYFLTTRAQTINNGNIITEPVRVFTNVERGYGIVAGINMKRMVFRTE